MYCFLFKKYLGERHQQNDKNRSFQPLSFEQNMDFCQPLTHESTFVRVRKSNSEVPAYRWSKKSANRCTEDGKINTFILPASLLLQHGTAQCQERPSSEICPTERESIVRALCFPHLAGHARKPLLSCLTQYTERIPG